MPIDVDVAVKTLNRMTVTQLRERYAEVFGEATRSFNTQHQRVGDSLLVTIPYDLYCGFFTDDANVSPRFTYSINRRNQAVPRWGA